MKTCERCGKEFLCGASKGSCWCMAQSTKNIPDAFGDCLCPDCLATFPDAADPADGPLVKDKDYYMNEEGLMVLTKDYLWRRGYCCQSGCTHCPYGFKRP